MRPFVAFSVGVLFALGLGISGMSHPTKVLAFLDLAGDWDPSLAFVMGGGVLVNFIVFRLALRRGAPLLAPAFSLPPNRAVDAPLVLGATIFGIGWGIGGFCPGPALVSLAGGAAPVIAFVAAMLGSMLAADKAGSAGRFGEGVWGIARGAAGRTETQAATWSAPRQDGRAKGD